MNKKIAGVLAGILLLTLLAGMVMPAFAAEPQTVIRSAEDLGNLAAACVLDSYSRNLEVSLEADLDLTGMEFEGIPYFNGSFHGNGHSISGLTLDAKGSCQGLFRYLGDEAVVEDLVVRGTVRPEGSRQKIGGIAGSNRGTIRHCSFDGEVTGTDCIGGIAGSNEVSGLIESCGVTGSLHGTHMVGGIAGENFGLIRACSNQACINTSSEDNDVAVSEITTDSILDTEAADTVTDLGGIAGISTGVIRSCENHAAVGYPHMGYNVGGIAGRQKGLIASCSNYGTISGRKEVAGIAGQMEPVANLEFEEDTLQILQDQLTGTSSLASQASSNLHHNSQALSGQMAQLHEQADTAVDAVRELLPTQEHPVLPDPDQLRAAHNTLSGAISEMQATMQAINQTSTDGIRVAAGDIRAISGQLSAMSHTINNASENLGGTITDLSDQDTEEDLTGKLLECVNYGTVTGDLNVGGIAGSVSWENDLDPEDDLHVSGTESLSFESSVRAVILRCRNAAEITAKKHSVGGICGNQSMGLIRECTNTGDLQAEKAQYVGGIAGTSGGFVRSCSVKCSLFGASAVGGIAGSASEVTDCRSLVRLPEEGEKIGTVLGEAVPADTEHAIRNNLYLSASRFGAIDGISYEGAAEPRTLEEFRNLPDLSPIFQQARIQFLTETGAGETITVPLGEPLPELPPVPEKEGKIGSWENLDGVDPEHVYFDLVLTPHYEPSRTVIESTACREDGMPVMLAEGKFTASDSFELSESGTKPELSEGQTLEESWQLPDFAGEMPTALRLYLPEDLDPEEAGLLVCGSDGTWRQEDVRCSGRHLVVPMQSGDTAVALVRQEASPVPLIGGGVLLAVVLIAGFLLIRRRNRRKKAE